VRPSPPFLVLTNPLVDGTHITTLATCSSSGFRPANINVIWLLEGGSSEVADTTTVAYTTNNTFAVRSEYRSVVSKIDNGKTLTCTLNHETLAVPLSGTVNLNISCNQQWFCYKLQPPYRQGL